MRRRAIPAEDKEIIRKITSDALENSGKKNPAKLDGSGIPIDEEDEEETKDTHKNINIFVPLIKANIEEQTITGLVLQPEVTDAQGDIMSAEVIAKAAHNFLSKYNKATTLGLQHKYFGEYEFSLFESWIAPQDVVINAILIKGGSWIMTVKVHDAEIWEMVKSGKLTGFSIGGRAKVKKVESEYE